MKNIKYLLLLTLSFATLTSCVDDTEDFLQNAEGPNVVTFDRLSDNLTGVAEDGGSEYTFMKKIKLVGPTVRTLTGDVNVTFKIAGGTTADGTMYRIENPSVTLTAEDNYLGFLTITLTTLGNEPPAEGSAAEETYVAPILNLEIVASGPANVVGSGKPGSFTLNFTPRNPYAGDYSAEIIYRRPGDGATGVYPNNINTQETNDKTLVGVTGRKCETWFAIAGFGVGAYRADITVNADNSVTYQGDSDAWGLEIKMGDPNRPDLISHYDPMDGKIYVYYYYTGGSGDRIFWEVFTPKF
jgi:hypothetical protein